MIFLGLDPGYARLGFGLVKATQASGFPQYVTCGVIETAPSLEEPERLALIEKQLIALLSEHKPTYGAVENLHFGKNLTTGVSVLHARGIMLLTLHKFGVDFISVAPASLKKMLSGFGRAPKKQMQTVVQSILKLNQPPQPDDAADGLALAIYSWLHFKNKLKLDTLKNKINKKNLE